MLRRTGEGLTGLGASAAAGGAAARQSLHALGAPSPSPQFILLASLPQGDLPISSFFSQPSHLNEYPHSRSIHPPIFQGTVEPLQVFEIVARVADATQNSELGLAGKIILFLQARAKLCWVLLLSACYTLHVWLKKPPRASLTSPSRHGPQSLSPRRVTIMEEESAPAVVPAMLGEIADGAVTANDTAANDGRDMQAWPGADTPA